MQIFWHGMSCIRLEAKNADIEATLLTDPYSNDTGLRFPRTTDPELLALSHQDKERFNLEGVGGTPFLIADPGEYEVKGIFVRGIQDRDVEKDNARNILYRFDAEGMSVGFLGQINRALTPFEIEELGAIDILALPVGGGSVLDAKAAAALITTIEPRVVIPMYYDVPGVKEKLADVDAFCKQLGVCTRQNVNKFKIAKKDLPSEDLLVAVIERA